MRGKIILPAIQSEELHNGQAFIAMHWGRNLPVDIMHIKTEVLLNILVSIRSPRVLSILAPNNQN